MSIASPSNGLNHKSPLTRANLENSIARAYGAQLGWSQQTVKERLTKLKEFRRLLVEHRHRLASALNVLSRQSYRETITAELFPLADAAQWITRRARRVLAPRYSKRRWTPLWLGAIQSTVYRVPHGLVLIIGAGNYPLFLTGVQILHALAAGNGVVIKPAPGAEKGTGILIELLIESGVPPDLLVTLDGSIESATLAIDIGVDKVVMTGSSRSGRTVLKQLSDSLTPSTMELSGCDAMYVLPGADLHRVCDILLFGIGLNGGATCMAPRRIFIPHRISEVFHRLLRDRLSMVQHIDWRTKVPSRVFAKLTECVDDSIIAGAKYFASERLERWRTEFNGNSEREKVDIEKRDEFESNPSRDYIEMGYCILTDVAPHMPICSADLFAPVSSIIPVEDWSEILHADSQSPYALTVSIYGPVEDALRLVPFISAGVITINDSIVPTADPQLPFGGRGESGFGVTRGDEGLLEMTVPKVVSIRQGNWLPHARPTSPSDEQLLDGLLQCTHGGSWTNRLGGVRRIIQAIMANQRQKTQ